MAAIGGWIAANTPEDQQALSQDDEDDLWKGVMARMQ